MLAHLLLDTGSQRSFIKSTVAQQLALPTEGSDSISVHTFASPNPRHFSSELVQFGLELRDGSSMSVTANALNQLTGKLQRESISPADLQFLTGLPRSKLADTIPMKAEVMQPDVLLGQDYFCALLSSEAKIQLPSGGLYLIPSKLGFLLGGQMSVEQKRVSDVYTVSVHTAMNQAISDVNLYTSAGHSSGPRHQYGRHDELGANRNSRSAKRHG